MIKPMPVTTSSTAPANQPVRQTQMAMRQKRSTLAFHPAT